MGGFRLNAWVLLAPELALGAILFLLGGAMASFAWVVIDRVERGAGLMGRSACASCGRVLGPFELVPLFSWLFLRGRCRGCGSRISVAYPVTEASFGLLALFMAYGRGFFALPTASGLIGLILALFALALTFSAAVIDLRTGYVHDAVMIPAVLSAILAAWLLRLSFAAPAGWTASLLTSSLWAALLPGLAGGAVILGLCLLTLGRGMGTGDAIPLTLLCLLDGRTAAFVDIIVAASVLAIPYIVFRVRKMGYARARQVPFVPCMAAGWLFVQILRVAGLSLFSDQFIALYHLI